MTVQVSTNPSVEYLMARRQHSFSQLWDGYSDDAAAKAARDEAYRLLKKAGIKSRRSVLRGQLREWASFGVPDGRSCDVYMLDVAK